MMKQLNTHYSYFVVFLVMLFGQEVWGQVSLQPITTFPVCWNNTVLLRFTTSLPGSIYPIPSNYRPEILLNGAWTTLSGNYSGASGGFIAILPIGVTEGIYQFRIYAIANGNNSGYTDDVSNTQASFIRVPPTVEIATNGSTTYCSDSPTTLSGVVNQSITIWQWLLNGSPITNSANGQTYQPTQSGSYSLKVRNTNGCETVSDPIDIIVRTTPIPNFNISKNSVCEDIELITFTNQTTPIGANVSYAWDFGDGTTSNLQSPIHTYTQVGSFVVTLSVLVDGECERSISKTVTVKSRPAPEVTIQGNTIVCSGESSTLSVANSPNAAEIFTFQWFYNGNLINGAIGNTYTPTASGNYQIRVRSSLTGCDSLSLPIAMTFQATPQSNILVNANQVCAGLPLSFTANTTVVGNPPITYLWQWNDGTSNTSTSATPSYTFQNVGLYEVVLITNALGCRDTTIQSIEVFQKPTALFDIPNKICEVEALSPVNNSENQVSQTWYFGDGQTSMEFAPSHTYATEGTYEVKLIVKSLNGCLDSLKKTVIVESVPQVDFTTTGPVCSTQNVQFTNLTDPEGSPVLCTWNLGNGITSTQCNPIASYTTGGWKTVSLTVRFLSKSSNCVRTITKQVYVAESPTADFNAPLTGCVGEPIFFENTSYYPSEAEEDFQYQWNFSDGTPITTEESPTHAFAEAGGYRVSLTAISPSSGCRRTIIQTIYIYSKPVNDLSFARLCEPNQIQLINNATVENNAINTTWFNFGDGQSSISFSNTINHTYANAGTYIVRSVATSFQECNADTAVLLITVYPVLLADFDTYPICTITPVAFEDKSVTTSLITEWNWSFGDGKSSALQNPSHLYIQAGNYPVKLTITDSIGCTSTFVKNILVNTPPLVDFSFSQEGFCKEGINGQDTLFLNNQTLGSNAAFQYQWLIPQELGTPVFLNQSNTYVILNNLSIAEDFYSISLIVTTETGCKDTLTRQIEIFNTPAIQIVIQNDVIRYGCEDVQVQLIGAGKADNRIFEVDYQGKTIRNITTQSNSIFNLPRPTRVNELLKLRFIAERDNCITVVEYDTLIFHQPIAKFSLKQTPETRVVEFTNESEVYLPITERIDWQIRESLGCKNTFRADTSFYEGEIIEHKFRSPTKYYNGLEFTTKHRVSLMINDSLGRKPKPNLPNELEPCTKDTLVEIVVEYFDRGKTYNAFSPNNIGDTENEYFRPVMLDNMVEQYSLEIFDRWGERVFQENEQTMSTYGKGWNGRVNNLGRECLPDTYTFILYIRYQDCDEKKTKGRVTLIR